MTDIVVNGRTYTDGPSLPDGSKLGMTPSAVDEGFRSNFLQHFIPDHLTVAGAATGAAATATTKAAEAEASASSAAASEAAAQASAAGAADSASVAQAAAASVQAIQYVACTGTNDALVAAPASAWTSYTDGLEIRIKSSAGSASTSTTPTINVSGLGTKTIVKSDGAALAVGDIASAGNYTLRYNTTSGKMHMVADKSAPPIAGTGIAVSGNQVSLAQMAANTIKGNNTGATANAADLTVAQAQALLNVQILDYCILILTGDQTYIPDATITKVDFASTYDGHNSSFVDGTNKRFKPTVASTWMISGHLCPEVWYGPGYNYAWITKNGTKTVAGSQYNSYPGPSAIMPGGLFVPWAIISFNGSSDYADMWVSFDTSGVAYNYNMIRDSTWLGTKSSQMLCLRIA